MTQSVNGQGPQGEGEGTAASCSVTSEKDSARGSAHHGTTAPKVPEVNEAGLEIIKVVVHLPGLSSAAEASLEVR